jgi:hypothetical protein
MGKSSAAVAAKTMTVKVRFYGVAESDEDEGWGCGLYCFNVFSPRVFLHI